MLDFLVHMCVQWALDDKKSKHIHNFSLQPDSKHEETFSFLLELH